MDFVRAGKVPWSSAFRVAAALIVSCCGPCARADDTWTLARQSDGITVYTRRVADSPLKAFKAEVDVGASVARVLETIGDPRTFPAWLPDLLECEVLRVTDTERFVYVATDAPWPVSDRDGVYHFTIVREDAARAVTIEVEALPDYVPPGAERVRIPKSDGRWRIEETPRGAHVAYEIHADPGGYVPAWLANLTVVRMPLQTLRNLRRELAR